jgi:hypothetical protein
MPALPKFFSPGRAACSHVLSEDAVTKVDELP